MICSLHQLRSNFCSVNFGVFTDYKTRRVKRWHPSGVPRTRFRVSWEFELFKQKWLKSGVEFKGNMT